MSFIRLFVTQVVAAQGTISVLVPPNFEAQSNINFTAVVSDGLVSVPRSVVVTVSPMERPSSIALMYT